MLTLNVVPIRLTATLVLAIIVVVGGLTYFGITKPTPPLVATELSSTRAATPLSAPIASLSGELRAGIRASRYGISPFPASSWWVSSTPDMASRFSSAAPEVVWIVGEVQSSTGCLLGFPNPNPGTTYPNITFKSLDENEAYFNAFDQAGVKIWLQVEPGNADVSTLIDLVITQYSHHPSVVGFGIDVEWYKNKKYHFGKSVTDSEATSWVNKIQTYNAGYMIFAKHWLQEKMPPTYRTGMVFINDGQGVRSLNALVDVFAAWGQAFNPAPVGFQFGYAKDKRWWKTLADPPKDIGNAILARVPNATDLVWVDFTAYDIWPAP
jgi:hypothetical protein